MRWPLRRRSDPPVVAHVPTSTPSTPEPPASEPPTSGPRPRPRTDWARLAPITAPLAPPITFDGAGFGRSVSGARTLTRPPTRRHRAEAPIGLLVDIAVVDRHSVEPARAAGREPATGPDGPAPTSTGELPASGALRHIERVVAPRLDADLMSSDTEWSMSSWERPATHDEHTFEAASWTPDAGFVTADPGDDDAATSTSRMRLVGQRGSFDDAVTPTPEPSVASSAPDAAREPSLRFVPVPGHRDTHDRPPSDLVAIVRQATGIDVGSARIDRSTATTDQAAAIGAIAFAKNGVVHLPNELGPLDDPAVRAITAHELTHVAQQRRSGGAIQDETSPEGRRLEDEARQVERRVGGVGAVTPTFLLGASAASVDRTGSPPAGHAEEPDGAGVQRRAADGDDFSWQGRPESSESSRRTTARQVLGTFSFVMGRPKEPTEAEQRIAAQQFEVEHAAELQQQRDVRFAEMVAEAEEELRRRDLREEAETPSELERRDHLELRTRLDQEMPWEFGPPADIDPYPGELPDADPETHRPGAAAHADGPPVPGDGPEPVRHAATQVPDAPTIGRNSGAALRHRTGGGPGGAPGDDDEPDFGWQDRGPTGNQMATSILGGALGGIFNSIFGDSEADEDTQREAAEKKALPKLIAKRKQQERTLRTEALRHKRAAALREESAFPVQLDRDDITSIREQIDATMPLEFNDPEYLDSDVDVSMDEDGQLGEAVADPPAEAEADADADAAKQDEDQDAELADQAEPDQDDADVGADSASASDDTESARTAAGSDDDASMLAVTAGAAAGAALDNFFDSDGDARVEPGADSLAAADVDRVDDRSPDLDTDTDFGDAGDADDAHRILSAASDFDLDRLAGRLYGRVRRDLRRELLVDRERAGVLADVH